MSKDNREMEDISGKFRKWLLEKDKWGLPRRRTDMCSDTLEIGFFYGYTIAQKEMQEKLDAAIEHINKLLEGAEDQCRFDHNGNCQDHGWFAYDNSCHVASARDFLKARGE